MYLELLPKKVSSLHFWLIEKLQIENSQNFSIVNFETNFLHVITCRKFDNQISLTN